jgi:hypothetical protein
MEDGSSMSFMIRLAQTATAPDSYGWGERILDFIDTPAPYSPFSEYLLVMFILWLIARRANRPNTFDTQAQEVLDQKYADGELSEKAYNKYRQEMALRPKR